jgi:hypothetical protein
VTRIQRSDLGRIADLLVDVGQRLCQTTSRDNREMPVAEAAWLAALDFRPGSRAQHFDPDGKGGWRYDDEGEPIPADPVGEAGITSDPTRLLHVRYRTLLGWLEDNAADLRDLVAQLVPAQPNTRVGKCGECGAPKPVAAKHRPKDLVGADVAAAGWCKSCYRDGQYMQPIETNRDGLRYYKDHCRWCGSFKAEWGIEPPVPLLELRHRYGRVTTAQVEQHLPKHLKRRAKKAS